MQINGLVDLHLFFYHRLCHHINKKASLFTVYDDSSRFSSSSVSGSNFFLRSSLMSSFRFLHA